MAYTKNTWVTGDIVTSEKLNHMEDGIENGNSALICRLESGSSYLDKTFGEIFDAYTSGKMVVLYVKSGTDEHAGIYYSALTINIGYNEEPEEHYDGYVEFYNYGTYVTDWASSYEALLEERVSLTD